MIIECVSFPEWVHPNSAGLLNVAKVKCYAMCPHLLDHPQKNVKNQKKEILIFWNFIMRKEKSRNFRSQDPFFHEEIAF